MKIICTLTALCMMLVGMAQNSSLTIFNNNGQQFFVIINGIRQNSLPSTNLRVESLSTQTAYEVKLIFADGKTGDIDKKLWFEESGNYLARVDFKKKNKKGKLKYFGMTPVGGNNSGGTTPVDYRPNDQAVYSDQQSVSNSQDDPQVIQPDPVQTVNTNTSAANTVTSSAQSTTTTIVNPDGSVTQTTTTVNPDGTVTETTTTSGGGNVNGQADVQGNANVNVTAQPGEINQSATVTDPTNPGATDVNISMNVSGTDPNATYDPNNPGNMGVNVSISGTGIDPNGNMNVSTGVSVNGEGMNQSVSSQSTTVTTTQTVNGQTVTTSSENGSSDESMGNAGYSDPGLQQASGTIYSCTEILVNEDDFITELNDMSFDDDKKTLILEDLKEQCLTAAQAAKIIAVLSFESDRLEVAKFLYDRMTDRDNAKKAILPLFNFDATKMEFREYIRE